MNSSALYRQAYKPVAKSVLTNGEILFTQLSTSQLSTVSVSPSYAAHTAKAQYGVGAGTRVVFESLGGFIDQNQIVHDWVGTQSFIPKAIPSYIVRIYETRIAALSPSPNHFWNVIVNATSGKIMVAFTFD